MAGEHHAVAVVGSGPRGTSVLERLCASAPELAPGARLTVHMIDPAPPGAGRVWRTAQPPELLMNTVASQVTLFTDESVTCAGPVRPGPSLYEWAVARGEPLGPDDYPPRALYGRYLEWFFDQVVRGAPDGVTVRVHRARAVRLTEAADGTQQLALDDGRRLAGLTAVVLAQGHLPVRPDPEEERFASYADRYGLRYHRPVNPADLDLSDIAPGEPVLLRGLGLNFFDHLALLTAGRGGVFAPDGRGGLVYRPSGREPRVYAGSRRGVPYHSRGDNAKGAYGRHAPLLLTPEVIELFRKRVEAGDPPDFLTEVWPLIAKEAETVYYEALLAHRAQRPPAAGPATDPDPSATGPRRTADAPHRPGTVPHPQAAAPHPTAADPHRPTADPGRPVGGPPAGPPGPAGDGFRPRFLAAAHHSPEEAAVLDAFRIPAAERWCWETAARPYRGREFAGRADFRHWLLSYLRQDVAHARQGNVAGPVKAALDVLRDLRNELRQIVDHGGLPGASRRAHLDRWYTPLNAFLSIGPPRRRTEELVALIEAGVVEVLGPGLVVEPGAPEPGIPEPVSGPPGTEPGTPEPGTPEAAPRAPGTAPGTPNRPGPGFLARSTTVPGPAVRVSTLIEARLPEPDLRRTADPLLADLLRTGGCRPHRVDGYRTGGLDVTPAPYRLIDAAGRPHPRRFAVGVPTEGVHWVTAAGARPGVNSVTLCDTDAVARAALRTPAGGASGHCWQEHAFTGTAHA
ncbi:FAD/NAD(P)-binding protein [Streptomyces pactum]|uniref:FAD/NAD(P)-binding protein n=1 Tax=Streptomyces pactum TaxID=68249 RepID=A0ABS0NHE1_9ACTN|nr:FAD/NAD(P)-binding protein [Streptomyces pactum]MBH5334616.1 FAD/NAD(P)-binding protein [Streptomyces pactum]